MSGFVNPNNSTPENCQPCSVGNPGGFINTTNDLTVTVQPGQTVPVKVTESLPAGTNHLGTVALATGLLPSTNTIGEVLIADGQKIAIDGIPSFNLNSSLPAGANEIGIVALKNGTIVALQPGTTVQLASGGNTIGNVGVVGSVTVSGTVAVSSLPNVTLNASNNKVGLVGIDGSIPAGTNNIGTVNLAPGTTVDVSSLDIQNVSLNAGTNNIGKVTVEGAIPAGSNTIGKFDINSGVNHIGQVGIDTELPAGTQTIGKVGLVSGTASIGKFDIQGRDQTNAQRTIATDTSGAFVPVNAIVTEIVVELLADTSTELLPDDPNRLLWSVQLMDLEDVLVSETGAALTTMDDPGSFVAHGGLIGTKYIPPMVTKSAITAISHATTKVRVISYSKV